MSGRGADRLGSVAALVALVAFGTGCKDKPKPPPPATGDGARTTTTPTPADWTACQAALTAAATAPKPRRVATLLDGCHPCGDWTPLLTWQTTQEDGGPNRKVIESTIAGCGGWCDPNAKQRFMGTLDDARINGTRAPWRELGEFCKASVSAVPDARFMSATYFALDRIARWAATQPDSTALLAAIELDLPAVSVTGAGYKLPTSPLSAPDASPAQLTISVAEIRVGTLPRAKLGADGITVVGGPYPGELVTANDLAATLDRLGEPIAVFAPEGMAASRIAEVLAAAGEHRLQLAVSATGGVPEWSAYGVVPIALGTKVAKTGTVLALTASADAAIKAAKAAGPAALKQAPVTIQLDTTATVASLATLLGAISYFEVPAVALVPPPPASGPRKP